MEQNRGGRVVGQTIAESTEVFGILLVKENRFEVEPVQQHQAAQPVGGLDRQCILAIAFERTVDQLSLGWILGQEGRVGINGGRSNRRISHPANALRRLDDQFGQQAQSGEQYDDRESSLHGERAQKARAERCLV